MTHHFYSLLTTLALLMAIAFTGCKGSQQLTDSTPEPKGSLLWEISGQGLDQPSYLYGTIHAIGGNDFFMLPEAEQAFAATEQLTLEIDMDDLNMMAMANLMMMDNDTSLEDLLSPEEYTHVRAFFIDSAGVAKFMVNQLERMMPMLSLSAVYPKMLDGKMKSYEQEFMKMAKKQDKEVLGVEEIEEQIDVIGQIPYRAQAEMLLEYADDFSGQKELLNRLIDMYQAQDIEGVLTLMDESEGGTVGEFEELLLAKRNRNWIPVIGEMAREKPTFFAVGAGHQIGRAHV